MSLSEALEARKAKRMLILLQALLGQWTENADELVADEAELRDENPEAEEPASTLNRPPLPNNPNEAIANGTGGSSSHSGTGTNSIQVEGVHTDSALVVTTNPLFPGAIMKKGGHSHHRQSTGGRASDVHAQAQAGAEGVEPVSAGDVEGKRGTRGSISRSGQTVSVAPHFAWQSSSLGRSQLIRQSPSMPTHSIGTRRSGRRSMIAAEQDQPATAAPVAEEAGVAVVDDDVPME